MLRIIQSAALIGDSLMMTPGIRALRFKYPDDNIIYHVPRRENEVHQTENHLVFKDNPYIDDVFVWDEFVPAQDDTLIKLDCMKAYVYACKEKKQISDGFANQMGVELNKGRYYDYFVDSEEVDNQLELMHDISDGKPLIIIGRHSASCTSNDPKIGKPNKCVANPVWLEVCEWLQKEGFQPVAVGAAKDEKDIRYKSFYGKKLYGLPLRDITAIISKAHAVLTIDTGIRHLAASVGTSLYCISGVIPLNIISCEPLHQDHKVYEEMCPVEKVTAKQIIKGAKNIL